MSYETGRSLAEQELLLVIIILKVNDEDTANQPDANMLI
jgi:hypothetical protein